MGTGGLWAEGVESQESGSLPLPLLGSHLTGSLQQSQPGMGSWCQIPILPGGKMSFQTVGQAHVSAGLH